MKMIKPVVNVSKIIDDYDTIVLGLRGVVYDGLSLKQEAVTAINNLKKIGKRIILVTNSAMRVAEVVKLLSREGLSDDSLDAVVTAGEIVHYKLKAKKGDFGIIGNKYYCIGSEKYNGVFGGLDYEKVSNIAHADFLYMSEVNSSSNVVEDYMSVLEYATTLSLPLLCVGNDSSNYLEGHISLASGTIAEQYAIMGGKIITVGKPDPNILMYSLDAFEGVDKSKTLLIGDSLSTDIKAANLIEIDSVLVSRGVHVNFLGEGYIPDISKARELSANFESYPDYIISNLRW